MIFTHGRPRGPEILVTEFEFIHQKNPFDRKLFGRLEQEYRDTYQT
jgi:hypothetical protein